MVCAALPDIEGNASNSRPVPRLTSQQTDTMIMDIVECIE